MVRNLTESELCKLQHHVNQFIGIAPLVVIPGHHFHKNGRVHNAIPALASKIEVRASLLKKVLRHYIISRCNQEFLSIHLQEAFLS